MNEFKFLASKMQKILRLVDRCKGVLKLEKLKILNKYLLYCAEQSSYTSTKKTPA
jgi:hypothetical protein